MYSGDGVVVLMGNTKTLPARGAGGVCVGVGGGDGG